MADQQVTSGPLSRRLDLGDAVAIGLAAMIGAGVFSVFAPAAAAAGSGLLVGLGVAAIIAGGNALSSAQLAMQYPESGGSYTYGRRQLGAWWGFVAGWGFVIGKTASCAAMALTFATNVVQSGVAARLLAAAAVVLVTGINLRGVTRTAFAGKVLVAITGSALLIVIGVLATSAQFSARRIADSPVLAHGGYGILQSAGLLFFAFAGYARIATLGEEVRDPVRTIPRAITAALGVVVLLYTAVACCLLAVVGPTALATSSRPLADGVTAVGARWALPVVAVGAAVASLGALLALIAGLGRTTLAMARERDLPTWLAGVSRRFGVPHHAELAIAAVVVILVLTIDLRHVIGFSSFGVLVYYGVANAAAYTQHADHRWHPRAINVVGVIGCSVLVVTLPWPDVVTGVAVLGTGLAGRWLVRRAAPPAEAEHRP